MEVIELLYALASMYVIGVVFTFGAAIDLMQDKESSIYWTVIALTWPVIIPVAIYDKRQARNAKARVK
jgi:hypothetical protein